MRPVAGEQMDQDNHCTQSLLNVRELTVEYRVGSERRFKAIDDIELNVLQGQVTGVLGESGSGKTTLAFALLNLRPLNAKVTRGSVLFRGQDLLRRHETELRRIRGARA